MWHDRPRVQLGVILIGLAALTMITYWQVRDNDFIYFDDPQYITENAYVQKGITVETITWPSPPPMPAIGTP
jgi:hypothetical protein